LSNGNISLIVNKAFLAEGRDCIIVDDICDGGRTFIEIAKQLPNTNSLTLVITHGIFSKGLKELEAYFDKIITTNSLLQEPDITMSKKLKIINIY
jgi:phosphoribosylpyrophosphate synthetase